MTYKKLLARLQKLTPQQLEEEIMFYGPITGKCKVDFVVLGKTLRRLGCLGDGDEYIGKPNQLILFSNEP